MESKKDKFEYFMEQTNGTLLRLESKVDDLRQFKWTTLGRIGGISVLISFVTSLAIGIATVYFGIR